MTHDEFKAGTWPALTRSAYSRLVQLAKCRLVGYEDHAEDVVSQVLIKWSALPPDRASVARIEQVIKTEASSWRRSEQRLHARERRAAADRALGAEHNVDSLYYDALVLEVGQAHERRCNI